MAIEQKIILGLRALVLVAALGVVGLGAWSKLIVHDVEARSEAVIESVETSEESLRYWRDFFAVVLDGTMRIWVAIAGASFSFLTMTLVILSTVLRSLEMPSSVRVPLELLSFGGIMASFGCGLSLYFGLNDFNEKLLESDSTDLSMFAMIFTISKAFVVTAGTGSILNLATVITAMVQACLRKRAKESCSFEPTVSALGMSGQPVAPIVSKSRIPTMYDPGRPYPSQDYRQNIDDEERGLIGKEGKISRADSGFSDASRASMNGEKEWPLGGGKQQKVPPMRPARPWSEAPSQKRGVAL